MRGVRGDVEFPAHRKSPILDEERNLVFFHRKPEPVLVLVANEIEAREPGPDIEPCEPKGVIVIPQRGRFLIVVVAIASCAKVGPRSANPGVNQASGSPSL